MTFQARNIACKIISSYADVWLLSFSLAIHGHFHEQLP